MNSEYVALVMKWSCLSSILCILTMIVQALKVYLQGKRGFQSNLLIIVWLTNIDVTMSLPVDETTFMFVFTIMANFLPSLGDLHDGGELVSQMLAFGISMTPLIIVIIYNISEISLLLLILMTFIFVSSFSVALMVPTSREYARRNPEAEHPSFVIASSPIYFVSGMICTYFACSSLATLCSLFWKENLGFRRFSVVVQASGVVIGGISLVFKSFTATIISERSITDHLNAFKVEDYWTQKLQDWMFDSYIPFNRRCRVIYRIKRSILDLLIAYQLTTIVICNCICLMPKCLLIYVSHAIKRDRP